MKTRTESCACGGSITAIEGLEAEAIRVHQRTPSHRRMFGEPSTEPDPYREPPVPEMHLSPMHLILGPVPCLGCGAKVRIVRYTGRILSLHPFDRFGCPGPGGPEAPAIIGSPS